MTMLTKTAFKFLVTSEAQKQHNNQTYFAVGTMGILMLVEIQTGFVDEPAWEAD